MGRVGNMESRSDAGAAGGGSRPVSDASGPGSGPRQGLEIALLTGGGDKPYALGLASALVDHGICLDFIGSDAVDGPELHRTPQVRFLNLRGSQRSDVSSLRKALRVLAYYARLLRYAATATPRVFHILWNNKCEWFDRTLLMLYYRGLGRRLVLTAHNVNAGRRDGKDTVFNRLTLRFQYRMVDHVFVHTTRMKAELGSEFGVPADKVSVIPFGINNTVPNTDLTSAEARRRLGLAGSDRVLLFFGGITPYKGIEYLVEAFAAVCGQREDYRLVIAGKPKEDRSYWSRVEEKLEQSGVRQRVLEKIGFVPDEETEIYFKAADVLVLPYTHVFQSGVLFLGYAFGLPVLAADVGSLREEIIEGKTGYVFRPQDAADLARAIGVFFASEMFSQLSFRRQEIQRYANERYSWSKVASVTKDVYSGLLRG